MQSSCAVDRGFSLIEAIVAMTLATLATLALAHVSIVSVHVNQMARSTTVATVAALQKMEQLRVSPLVPSPPDALRLNTPGYCDFVDPAGAVLGGAAVPAGAAFVRRWSVEPLQGGLFVLQVSLVSIRFASAPGAVNAPRRPGEVRLVDVTKGGA